jgi:hypothetical protein
MRDCTWPACPAEDGEPEREARDGARGMNIRRASPAARLSLSLLPYEIVRIKPVQVIKIDRVVVARRMQHHAVRRRACLFVADTGVAREKSMVIDGSSRPGCSAPSRKT